MSDIESLRAEVYRLEARNRELDRELSELTIGISDGERNLSDFRDKVRNYLTDSTNMIDTSEQRVVRSGEIMGEIKTMYARFKNMELANKAIRECNNKIYYDFVNYTTVRKIVRGILDNLNLNMISDNIIYKSIETQHLQTPDYWLTSVLLSIMAWKNDDIYLAKRAIDVSVKLDKKSSAVFYMLFNIRMSRDDAAMKWFHLYQECDLKGSDNRTFLMLFSLLNDSLNNVIDERIKYEISDFINKTVHDTENSNGFNAANSVNTIESYLKWMKSGDDIQLNMVKRCFDDYKEVSDVVMSAKNNMRILQFILDISNVSESEKNDYIDRFINDEIAKPNDVEKGVYEEIEYNELIISRGGDVNSAKKQFAAQKQKKQNDLNIIGEMIDWVYTSVHSEDITAQTRKNMFSLTGGLQEKAAEQYIQDYRSRVRHVHPVTIGEYKTDMDFKDTEGEKRKITKYFEQIKESQLSEINNIKAIIGAVITASGIAAGIFLSHACLILAGIGVLLLIYNFASNKMTRQHINDTCELNIRNKTELMEKLFDEYGQLSEIYREYDSYADKIIDALQPYQL